MESDHQVHMKQYVSRKCPSVWQRAVLVDISQPLIPIIGSTFPSALVWPTRTPQGGTMPPRLAQSCLLSISPRLKIKPGPRNDREASKELVSANQWWPRILRPGSIYHAFQPWSNDLLGVSVSDIPEQNVSGKNWCHIVLVAWRQIACFSLYIFSRMTKVSCSELFLTNSQSRCDLSRQSTIFNRRRVRFIVLRC